HYAYDQEGTPAQRAVLVEDGIFRGFLMSRSPIEGFDQSNGHGRAQTHRMPVARMANTLVLTSNPRSLDDLRRTLRRELANQDREWGLVVDEIGGGFTLTGRMFPNAFNVRATYAWKIYADGRPDELIRGVDLVGTPLVALSNVIAAGDDPDVFNGFCGAESGSVPNSAVSPSLLISNLEVQKKESGTKRPPLLPKPARRGQS
ncbi:MAG: metallopeptidase TldD-related protein, partial [Myxococcota bacterium]|nr:metallopeptidase TldD-related protein [Myxococcota bacterium]